MPRSKAHERHGTQSYPVRPVKFTEGFQRLLCNDIGLRLDRPLEEEPSGPLTPDQVHTWKAAHDTPAESMLHEVSDVLGSWPAMQEALDHAPTVKECAAALHPVETHANALRVALDALDSRSRRLLERPPTLIFENLDDGTRISDREPEDPLLSFEFDLDRFYQDLSIVRARAGGAVREAETGPHHAGASPHAALEFMVLQLVKVFAFYDAFVHERIRCEAYELPSAEIVRSPVLEDPFGSRHPERRLSFVEHLLEVRKINRGNFKLKRYLKSLDG